jgi:alpha-beta hydrolase superfamily lysophospholipase
VNTFIGKIAIVVFGIAVLWLMVAVILIFLPAPTFSQAAPVLPAPWPANAECHAGADTRCFEMLDGAILSARWIDAGSHTTVIFLHGVLGFSGEYETTAQMLMETTGANVLAVDLRGHGYSAGKPGDIDYIGQYEDDVVDIVKAIRREDSQAKIVLAGHSMGGGIVMRYAVRSDMLPVDAYLLFAPHLGSNSPTSQPKPTEGAAAEAEPFLKVHLPRILGLTMLNMTHIDAFNNLDTLYFNLPDNFPVRSYSFRAAAGMTPDDYKSALMADERPMLVVVGQNDEAFRVDQYPEVISLHANSTMVIIDGESHDGVTRSPLAFEAIKKWMDSWSAP